MGSVHLKSGLVWLQQLAKADIWLTRKGLAAETLESEEPERGGCRMGAWEPASDLSFQPLHRKGTSSLKPCLRANLGPETASLGGAGSPRRLQRPTPACHLGADARPGPV